MGAKSSKADGEEGTPPPAFKLATVSVKFDQHGTWDVSEAATKTKLRTVDDAPAIAESDTVRQPTNSFHLQFSNVDKVFGPSPWTFYAGFSGGKIMKTVVSAMQIDAESHGEWLIIWSVIAVEGSEYLCLNRISPKSGQIEQIRWFLKFEARDSFRDYMFSPNGRTLAIVTGACSMFCRLPLAMELFVTFSSKSPDSLFVSETDRLFQWQYYQGMHVCKFITDTTLICSGSVFSDQGRIDFLETCNPVCRPVVDFNREYLYILDIEDEVVYSLSEKYYAVKEGSFETCGLGYLIAFVDQKLTLFDFSQRTPDSNSKKPRKGLILNQKPYIRDIGQKWKNKLQEFGSNSNVSEPAKIISQGISGKFLLVMTDRQRNIAIVDMPTLDEQWYLEISSFKLDFDHSFLCGLGLVCRPSDTSSHRRYKRQIGKIDNYLSLLELPVYDYIAIYEELLPFFNHIDGLCTIAMSYWSLPDVSPESVKLLLNEFPSKKEGYHLADGIDKVLLVAPGKGTIDVSYMSYHLFEQTSVPFEWVECYRYFESD